ncbi:death domain-containing protein CRADD [Petromyzon marinus]|uniref:Death domain-containing protein CRADD n=1 Tax=Petromyzon marinus TaxID=7757 RepID=A0AAJ7T4X5_PETMA|nr:death domain-containing protein CRADD [Petromyzon marinus]
MDQRHKLTLRRLRTRLASEMCVESASHYLYQEGIISAQQLEEVLAERGSRRRAYRLLDELPRRGPRAFAALCEALREDSPWLLDSIVREESAVGWEEAARGDPLDGVLANFPPEFLDSPPDELQLSRLAASLGPECEHLVSALGVTQARAYHCRVAHPHSAHAQTLAMLLAWRQGAGSAATRRALCLALQQAEVDLHTVFSSFLPL